METALNTPKVSFEDFYEVPNLKFDIDRLRKDLEIILKEKKLNDGLEATLKEVIYEVKSSMLATV